MSHAHTIPRQLVAFGTNVRRLRMAREMTQERLAELVDLNIRTLQRVEAGETNLLLTTVIRFKQALHCQWEELIPRVE